MKWKFNEKSKYKKVLDKVKEEKRADIHSFHRYFGKLIPMAFFFFPHSKDSVRTK